MPRNSSGVYSLPESAFVAGTAIVAAKVNSDLSDIATALTGSLPVNGAAPMTGPLKLADGVLSAPALTFNTDTNTGIYSTGADAMVFVTGGAAAISVSSTQDVALAQDLSVAGEIAATGQITVDTSVIAFGQCRLILSGGSLLLFPYQGNLLYISNNNKVIPAAGVSLSASGVSASTFYYIYAYMNGSTMTLEYSTTGYTISSSKGIAQKTGDTSRTLVGAAFTTAGSAWSDTNGARYVISYYNRKIISSVTTFSVGRVVSAGVAQTEVNSEIRGGFISWSDETVNVWITANLSLAAGVAAGSGAGIQIDATTDTVAMSGLSGLAAASLATSVNPFYSGTGLTENTSHYATMVATANTAAVTVVGGAVNASNPGSYLRLEIKG